MLRNKKWIGAALAVLAAIVGISSVADDAPALVVRAATNPCPYPLVPANRPVAPASAPAETATFTDPTVELQSEQFVRVPIPHTPPTS